MPTVNDIANRAGVSKSTVSLVLNNKEGVSETMRQRVLEAQRALESESAFVPKSASDLPYNRSVSTVQSVLVLHTPEISPTPYINALLRGIHLGADNYNIQLRIALKDVGVSESYITSLYFSAPEMYPSGVVIININTHQFNGVDERARQLGIPFVLTGVPSLRRDITLVAPDETSAGYDATRYLLDLGHRAIAFMGGDQYVQYHQDRLNGYRAALQDHGVTARSEWVFVDGDPQVAAQRFAQQKPDVTALLVVNDYSSHFLPVVQQAGYRIPDDLSVIVFDDFEYQQTFNPPLTTMSYPLVQQGFWTIRALMDQINEPLLSHCQYAFKAEMVERQSCIPVVARTGERL